MYKKKHFAKDSLFYQIQKMIAVEALSPYVLEIYLKHVNKKPKIFACYTTIPNPYCICTPEKIDKYQTAPNHIIKKLSANLTRHLAYEKYFDMRDHQYNQN